MADSSSPISEKIYDYISGDEDARICKDISEEACKVVPGNFLRQVSALTCTKTGDALSKPGLVLTWLLTALGAPASAIGILVPVRESGSLLLQMWVGGFIRRFPIRKGFWVGGSIAQGLAVLGMAVVAMTLQGAAAGWSIVGLLAIFSLARGVCSVTSKDLLGKTIPKTRRGRLSGLASSISGYAAVAVGLFFVFNQASEVPLWVFALLLAAAGALWLVAALLMSLLDEKRGATSGAGHALKEALESLRLLREDALFRKFCIARGLLAGTVLSMPYYVILAHGATGGRMSSLGILMVAGSVATAVSAAVWGKLADRSSRLTLAIAGTGAGLIGGMTAAVGGMEFSATAASWFFGGLFFLIGLAHTGIRLGRKTYLVDMANSENRAAYVAVSNTLIGVILLLGGSLGFVAEAFGPRAAILVFAVLGLGGGVLSFALPEVQEKGNSPA